MRAISKCEVSLKTSLFAEFINISDSQFEEFRKERMGSNYAKFIYDQDSKKKGESEDEEEEEEDDDSDKEKNDEEEEDEEDDDDDDDDEDEDEEDSDEEDSEDSEDGQRQRKTPLERIDELDGEDEMSGIYGKNSLISNRLNSKKSVRRNKEGSIKVIEEEQKYANEELRNPYSSQ